MQVQPKAKLTLQTRGALIKLGWSLVLAAGFLGLLRHGGLPVIPPLALLQELKWWVFPLGIVTFVWSAVIRSVRWLHLVRSFETELSSRRIFGISLVGLGAVLFAPLRMGEVVRPYLLSRDGQITFTKALTTVAAERIVDGLFISTSLLVALLATNPLGPLSDHVAGLPLSALTVRTAAYGALALFLSLFTVMALFYSARDAARRFALLAIGWASPRAAVFLVDKIDGLTSGLRVLASLGRVRTFLIETCLYWFGCGLGYWAIARGSKLDLSFSEAWVTLGITSLGIMVPAGPGFFGAYQLATYCGLALFLPESQVLTSGSVFVFVVYTINLIVTLIYFVLGLWLSKAQGQAASLTVSRHE